MSFHLSFDAARYPEHVWTVLRSEEFIQKEIVFRLRQLKFWVEPYEAGNKQGRARGGRSGSQVPAGQCDLMAVKNGKLFCIEVKRPGVWEQTRDTPRLYRQVQKAGALKPEQVEFLAAMETHGVLCVVAWHWLDVEKALKTHGYL